MLQRLPGRGRAALSALLFMFTLALSGPGAAELAEHTPPPGSAERRALLDTARAPLAGVFLHPVLFTVQSLRVAGDWAFMLASMSAPDGAPLTYRDAEKAEAAAAGGLSNALATLLRRDAHGWQIVAQAVGPTDVAWEGWAEEYHAPAELFVLSGPDEPPAPAGAPEAPLSLSSHPSPLPD